MRRYQYIRIEEFESLFDELCNAALDHKKYELEERFLTAQTQMHHLFDVIEDECIEIVWKSENRITEYFNLFNQLIDFASQHKEYGVTIAFQIAQIAYMRLIDYLTYDELDDYLCMSDLSYIDGLERFDGVESHEIEELE